MRVIGSFLNSTSLIYLAYHHARTQLSSSLISCHCSDAHCLYCTDPPLLNLIHLQHICCYTRQVQMNIYLKYNILFNKF